MGGATSRVAGDATAFGDRDMGWMLSIDTVWEDPADDQKNLDWARAFWADMKHHSNGRNGRPLPGSLESSTTPGTSRTPSSPLRFSRPLREFVDSTASAAADRQALRRRILGVVTGPAEPLTGAIAR